MNYAAAKVEMGHRRKCGVWDACTCPSFLTILWSQQYLWGVEKPETSKDLRQLKQAENEFSNSVISEQARMQAIEQIKLLLKKKIMPRIRTLEILIRKMGLQEREILIGVICKSTLKSQLIPVIEQMPLYSS
jgi:hypothetical protein